jgi:hypothetical protein
MRAKDVMIDDVICISVKESVFDAAELLLDSGVGAAPARRMRSASLTMPTTAPLSSTTGRYGCLTHGRVGLCQIMAPCRALLATVTQDRQDLGGGGDPIIPCPPLTPPPGR